MSPPRALLLLLLTLSAVARAAPPDAADGVEARAKELEHHLLAPCCYRETLDVHESPVATELRRELRRRLGAGEPAEAIEASLVARYGEKVQATLPGSLGYVLAALILLGGPALLVLLWRRLRARPAAAPAPAPRPPPLAGLSRAERRSLEDRLDDDLEAAL